MNYQIAAVTQANHRLHTAMAMATMAVLVLTGCSNSSSTMESESPGMNNTTNSTEFSAELNDPSGEIAGLEFLSAEDDAIYQCLLSAATASATTRGLQAYPVRTVSTPAYSGAPFDNIDGVYASWCKTVGAGDAVGNDISACQYDGDFNAPGTEALQLIAAPDYGVMTWDKIVKRIEFKSFKVPEQESTDLKVEYWLGRGRDQIFFNLAFVPFDGNTYNQNLRVSFGSSYRYYDPDLILIVNYQPSETLAEQKSLLASSAMQLSTITTTNYEALKIQVAQELNLKSSLDAAARQAALARATTEIDRRINVINQNSEAIHRLILEQFAIEECG